ncbi:hypothetical protein SH2C18_12450 [Clostridium sediminicola]|uniref:amidase domain-containing protein n=1 Tax=Clostridium sediminicola TaxID=3114879 RepID=UPI0031F218E7
MILGFKNKRYLMQYNREKAVRYAIQYAKKPNTIKYPYYKGKDCANFVSQCLYESGINETGDRWDDLESWFCKSNNSKELKRVSLTWRAARYFRRYWGNENGLGNNRAYQYIELMHNEVLENINQIYSWINIGDVIQYGKRKDEYNPSHTQIVINKKYNRHNNRMDIFMAQHSENRIYISLYDYINQFNDKELRRVYLYKIAKK